MNSRSGIEAEGLNETAVVGSDVSRKDRIDSRLGMEARGVE